MARINSSGTSTTIKEREYDSNLLDMIDKKLSSNTESAVKSAMKRFDNSHSTEDLNKVYDDLDMDQFISDSRDSVPITDTQPREKKTIMRVKNINNPFVEKSSQTKQSSYNDIVTDTVAPKMEIKSYTPVKPAKKSLSARIKLWLVTGICCLVLIGGAITATALNIGNVAGSNAVLPSQFETETTQLASRDGIINKTGQDLSADTVSQIINGTTIDGVAETVGEKTAISGIVPSTNIWDKISAFIAHLFGR